jgi:S-formylglutathione hydrolase
MMATGWGRAEVVGREADVFTPPVGSAGRGSLLWLHSEGGEHPDDLPGFTALLAAHRLPCVAPRGGVCWWVDRVCPGFDPAVTPEQHLLAATGSERRWAVAGIGMGGQGAVRLAFRHPTRFPVAAALDGAFDFHDLYGRGTPLDDLYPTRERARQDTAVLHLDPSRWPQLWLAADPAGYWHRGADRLHEKLAAYGVPHAADLDTTGSDYRARMLPGLVAFVATGLAAESRRLM